MAIEKRGKTWQYVLDLGIIDGKRKRITKGGFKTKKECEIALIELKETYNKTNQVRKVSDISFVEYIDVFYREYVLNNCKPRTQDVYRDYIELQLKPYFRNYKLKDIDTNTVYNFIVSLSKKYSKNHTENIRSFLGSSFKFAIFPKQFIFKNPMENLTVKNIKYMNCKEKVVLTKENMMDIFECLEDYPHFLLPIQIMYYTGMRISEVCGLTWDNVDFVNRMIYVRNQYHCVNGTYQLTSLKTKSSIRDISMSDTLYNILSFKKADYDLSDTTHNHVCTGKDINVMLNKERMHRATKIIERNVCHFNCHAIRHLHATMLIEAGASIKDVSYRLGHSTTDITYNIYVELSKKQKDKTIQLLNDIF